MKETNKTVDVSGGGDGGSGNVAFHINKQKHVKPSFHSLMVFITISFITASAPLGPPKPQPPSIFFFHLNFH